MAEKISGDILNRIITSIEYAIKDLEVKETALMVKRTKDIELIYNRTANTIKKTKNILNSAVDSQIFGKDN